MVMFAGQKYRQFNGYPCNTAACFLLKMLIPNMAGFAANFEFFAQEYDTWVSYQPRQDACWHLFQVS